MLDVFIIEWLRKREQERQEEQRPFLELPLNNEPVHIEEEKEKEPRGVVVIEL